jgi:hypothetical protein
LDVKLGIAEVLEIDPYTDRSALLSFDNALSGFVFTAFTTGDGRDSIAIMAPEEYQGGLVALRAQPVTPKAEVGAPPTAIIYVNGIRTTLRDVTRNGTGTYWKAVRLARTDTALVHAQVKYFYNRNLAEQLDNFDHEHGCAGVAVQFWGIGKAVTSFKRCVDCKLWHGAIGVTQPDLVESIDQYMNVVFGTTSYLAPVDVTNLASKLVHYHHALQTNTILLTHSQGNLVASQTFNAIRQQFGYDGWRCTGEVAMAPPIGTNDYGPVDSSLVRGFTISLDPLLMFSAVHNIDFPRYETDRSLFAADSLSRTPLIHLNTYRKVRWELSLGIHDVNHNYFDYGPSADSVRARLRYLYDKCRAAS